MSSTEKVLLPVPLSIIISDYSTRSLWWATLVFVLVFMLTFFFLKYQNAGYVLWNAPGSRARPLFLAIAILRSVMKNKGCPYNVISYQALCGVAHIYDRERLLRFWFGVKPVVMFFKPETVEAVLSSSSLLDKTFVYDFLAPWFKEGLITSSGAKWRKRRKLLTPAFHFRILDDFLPVIDNHAQYLATKLQNELGKDWFDLVPYITLCSLDILCETAMGKYVGAQKSDSPYVKALNEASRTFATRLMTPWLWSEFIFARSKYGKLFKECTDIMDDFTRGVIRERKTCVMNKMKGGMNMVDALGDDDFGMKRRKAFLDLLLYEHMSDSGFTEEDITEEVNTFMFAGHDTTAVGMSWALYLIGRHPTIQTKLQEEIDEVFGDEDRPFTLEDLKNLKYLECVLKKALCEDLDFLGNKIDDLLFSIRPDQAALIPSYSSGYCSPATFEMDYKQCISTFADGYTIPKGTTCMVFTYMLHRNPEVFPNPEKFDPDRFLPENSVGRHPYAYVPFSAGPRNCIGQRFAVMEQKVVLTHVLRNYNIYSLVPQDELLLTAEMVLRSAKGIKVRLMPRKS